MYWNNILHDENKQQIKILKKLTNVCLRNYWKKSHKGKWMYN